MEEIYDSSRMEVQGSTPTAHKPKSQDDILGSMNIATNHLGLTENHWQGINRMYVGRHSCHQQWTIHGRRKFQPTSFVSRGRRGHVNLEFSKKGSRTANAVRV
jgi:hypothetical protein